VAERFLPHLAPDELAWRIPWCLFGVLGARLCDDELDLAGGRLDRELDRIVTALVGALQPPPIEGTP
jgi:hypothetical protein